MQENHVERDSLDLEDLDLSRLALVGDNEVPRPKHIDNPPSAPFDNLDVHGDQLNLGPECGRQLLRPNAGREQHEHLERCHHTPRIATFEKATAPRAVNRMIGVPAAPGAGVYVAT